MLSKKIICFYLYTLSLSFLCNILSFLTSFVTSSACYSHDCFKSFCINVEIIHWGGMNICEVLYSLLAFLHFALDAPNRQMRVIKIPQWKPLLEECSVNAYGFLLEKIPFRWVMFYWFFQGSRGLTEEWLQEEPSPAAVRESCTSAGVGFL